MLPSDAEMNFELIWISRTAINTNAPGRARKLRKI
jgi:hypothetical protein